jgi:PleD family two-component response regulator
MGGHILVVDHDAVMARFLAADLERHGYSVDVLFDGAQTLEHAALSRPELVILDVDQPGCDGIELLRQLRANPPTATVPVILLTARASAADKVLGFTAGADDCIVKPFDPLELLARVGGTLRRTADFRALSPLTGLPGNHRIEVEIASRAAAGEPYAVCHVDLDEFKGFNDVYGFQRGDELLLLLAGCLQRAVARAGEPPAFLGHVGGADFGVLCQPEQAEVLCHQSVQEFDAASGRHYDPEVAERGWLEVVDRRGELRRQPLVSVSVGLAAHRGGERDFRAVVAAATEMKSVAKSVQGSWVAVDRRA